MKKTYISPDCRSVATPLADSLLAAESQGQWGEAKKHNGWRQEKKDVWKQGLWDDSNFNRNSPYED